MWSDEQDRGLMNTSQDVSVGGKTDCGGLTEAGLTNGMCGMIKTGSACEYPLPLPSMWLSDASALFHIVFCPHSPHNDQQPNHLINYNPPFLITVHSIWFYPLRSQKSVTVNAL